MQIYIKNVRSTKNEKAFKIRWHQT